MSRKIEIEIIGNARSLESALGKATHRSNVFGKALKALAVVGVGAAVVGLQQSVKAALEAEVSQSRLQQSFKNSHLSLQTYSKSLERTEKAARALGFGDNDVRESLGSLMTATDSYKKSLSLLTVAQNIARFKHIDLVDATKMLTMAMTGSQRATKQLGLTIAPVTSHVDKLKKAHAALSKEQQKETAETYKQELAHAKLQDKMATGEAVIAAVTAKTKGQAEAYGKTAAGNIAKFTAEFDHLKAELGKGLLPILSAGTQRLTGFVTSFETKIPMLRQQFGGLAQVVGTAGKALVSFGSSRVGQSAIAGLATTFVGSGLVGEVHSFIDLLKTMNPVLIGVGAAAGIFGGVLYAIMTSTGGMTRELLAAKQAINGVKDALNNSAQAGQNLIVARHQLTGAEIAHKEAVKNTAEALKAYGRHSDQYKAALNAEAQTVDAVKQGQINLKNSHQAVRQAAIATTNATLRQSKAFDDLRGKAVTLFNQSQTGLRGYQIRAEAARQAALGFGSALKAGVASDYARAIGSIVRAMGGTRSQVLLAQKAVIALAIALGRLPTRKEINIIVTEQTRSSRIGHRYGPQPPGQRTPRAGGGFIPMGAGQPGVDSVAALLTPGEVVLNRRQQDAFGGPEVFREMFGFASGGIAGKRPRHIAPHLPGAIREAEARAAGTKDLGDDIAAYTSERSWVDRQLGRKDLTHSERESLRVRRIRLNNRIGSLKKRQAKARQKKARDFSQLPPRIRLAISKSHLTPSTVDDLAALHQAEAWLVKQLKRKGLTNDQRADIIDALVSVRDEIKAVEDAAAADTADAGDTGDAGSEDLRAQLDQANARLASEKLRADLANAFGNTGVFAGGGGGGGGGYGRSTGNSSGGATIVLQSLVAPTDEMMRHATRVVAQGMGSQGYRQATNERLGV